MSDMEEGSIRYYQSRARKGDWSGFLRAMAEELGVQMPPEELRSFFFVIGSRIATQDPLPKGASLGDLETNANAYFGQHGWGWVKIRNLPACLEFTHACAPLREVFGDSAMAWSPALLEGIYATWLKQSGAGGQLELRQVGGAEGPADTFRFRLANPGYFA